MCSIKTMNYCDTTSVNSDSDSNQTPSAEMASNIIQRVCSDQEIKCIIVYGYELNVNIDILKTLNINRIN